MSRLLSIVYFKLHTVIILFNIPLLPYKSINIMLTEQWYFCFVPEFISP